MKRGQAFCSFLVSLGVGEVKSANKLCALVQEQTDFLYSRAFPNDMIQKSHRQRIYNEHTTYI